MHIARAAIISTISLALFATTCAFADDWFGVATVSDTMGTHLNPICLGDGSDAGIGCPTTAPSITTIGDGSGSTGLPASSDRITSGTTSIEANSATYSINFTTAGRSKHFAPAKLACAIA